MRTTIIVLIYIMIILIGEFLHVIDVDLLVVVHILDMNPIIRVVALDLYGMEAIALILF